MQKKVSGTSPPWLDPDDAPPWGANVFERAEIRHGGKIVREAQGTLTKLGRPKSETPKVSINLRLDGDVLEHFRNTGPGWQTRINDYLRTAIKV